MIQLQQEYASQLLSHINPYTNLHLVNEPAVAFVEISNDDSMLYSFANDQLGILTEPSTCFQGMSCGLPESYSADLNRLWNQWLTNKYGSDETLKAARNPNTGTPDKFLDDLLFKPTISGGWTPIDWT